MSSNLPDTSRLITGINKEIDALDLVCNEGLISEKSRRSVWQSAMNVMRSLLQGGLAYLLWWAVVPPLIILALLLLAAGIVYCLGPNPLIPRLSIMVGSASFAAIVWWLKKLSIRNFKEFPTNLEVTSDGLRLAWRSSTTVLSECFSWDSINFVSCRINSTRDSSQAHQGIVLLLDIDISRLTWEVALAAVVQTRRLWRGFLPFGRVRGILCLGFPLDALTLEADKFRLMSAINAKAPEIALSEEFKELLQSRKAPTYTQLWLDEMQSFRRRSTQELPGETMLHDGRYKILEKLATGGQAKIYKALDESNHTYVALKELILPVNAGAEVRNRAFANVKKESLLISGMDHPGIPKLLDNFVQDHRAYLVHEFIQGRTLRQIVQTDGPLDCKTTIAKAIVICDILAYLHNQAPPVVHRDLTPDNLMLSEDGRVVLIDFNVAQQLESATTKTVVGKHHYMAPEQFKGRPTTQSDLYSLGCTMYYLLTGADPLPLSSSRPSTTITIPSWIDDIIAKLTELQPASRYLKAEEVETDLRLHMDEMD